MGCGKYASNFVLEIGKYWHFKNRGHLQIARTVFVWHINLFFRDFFINIGDLNYGKAEKAAVMDTEKKKSLSIHIQDKSILLLILFSRHQSYQSRSW